MIDTHCHVDFEEYDDDREDVILKSKDRLSAIVNSGTSSEGNVNVLKLSEEYSDFIYPTLGFHPIRSCELPDDEINTGVKFIEANIDRIVGIGEVGMDFFYVKDKSLRQRQMDIFEIFVGLAVEYGLPLVIHARDADKKAFNIVEQYSSLEDVVFHCYGGSLKTARRIMDSGYFISFSTMACYSERHQDLIREVPLDFILTETDSPYLSPFGDRNVPFNVCEVGKLISEIKGVDFSVVDRCTERNARSVFKI